MTDYTNLAAVMAVNDTVNRLLQAQEEQQKIINQLLGDVQACIDVFSKQLKELQAVEA